MPFLATDLGLFLAAAGLIAGLVALPLLRSLWNASTELIEAQDFESPEEEAADITDEAESVVLLAELRALRAAVERLSGVQQDGWTQLDRRLEAIERGRSSVAVSRADGE